MTMSRRTLLAGATAAAVTIDDHRPAIARPAIPPGALARDEAHWRRVAQLFDAPPPGIIPLEAGHFGAMPRTVRLAYEQRIDRINRETTLYTRGAFDDDMKGCGYARPRCSAWTRRRSPSPAAAANRWRR